MTSIIVDDLDGVRSSKALKTPCRVATTAGITLSGLQSIDGVTVAADDRVLVWNQSNPIDNGIWNASAGTWSRAEDFNGRRDVTAGTQVLVTEGSTYADHMFQITTPGDITIGQTSLAFQDMADIGAGALFLRKANNLGDVANAATARNNLGLGPIATQNANNVAITGGTIAGITDLAVADGGTGASTAGAARGNLSAAAWVANRTALKALAISQDKAAIIYNEGGRSGIFAFNSANLSSLVTADTQEGIYVAPTSDVTGASGAWVRVYEGTLYPWWFGAVGDNSTNDAVALQAWLTFGYSTAIMGDYATLDGGGRSYRTDVTLAVTGTIHERELCNVLIRAGNAAASPILDFSGVTSITRCTFRNCNINAWGIGNNCVLLHHTQGVLFSNCEITCGTTGYGIKDLNTDPACEVNIDHCLISGPESANTCTGIWYAGHDSKIRNTTVRYCNPCIRLDGDAYLVLGNHIYSWQATNTAEHDVGIYLKGASGGDIVISGNYIDNVSVFAESLNNVNLTDNKWLTQAQTGITPAWVIWKPLGANFGIVNFVCTGNVFVCKGGTPATVESFKIDTSAGSLDANSIFNVIIWDNTFFNTTYRSSHPKGSISYSAATIGTKNFAALLPFGAGVKSYEGAAMVPSSGSGSAFWFTLSGTTVTGTTASSFTGKLYIRVSINNDDEKP